MPEPVKPATPGAPARRGDLRACLLLALACLLVYNANMRLVASGDSCPARYLPLNILEHGTLYFDRFSPVAWQGNPHAYWIQQENNGHYISLFPVVIPVLVTPLYLPAAAWLHWSGWTPQHIDFVARLMDKLVSSLIATLSVVLFYLLLRRRVDARTALLLAIAFAFGTNTWMISSQTFWQHGLGQLLIILSMLLLTGPCSAWRAFAVGAVFGLMGCNRPPDSILAAGLGLCSLFWAGRRAPLVFAGVFAAAAPFIGYNLVAAGNIFGGYGDHANADFFGTSLATGIAGLLVSPMRGLFVFTPFLLFLLLPPRRAAAGDSAPGEARWLTPAIWAGVVLQMLLYAKADWRGGYAWGPRWLTDMLPLLVWLIAPGVAALRAPGRAAFTALVGASIAIQAIGAFWYTGVSEKAVAVQERYHAMDAAWDIHNVPFIVEFQHPRAPFGIALQTDGYIDNVKTGRLETGEAVAGTPINVTGWALVDRQTPALVIVSLFPGNEMITHRVPSPVGATATFRPRPDIAKAMHTDAPAWWDVTIPTKGLPPGMFLLSVMAQAAPGGEFRFVAQRPFRVLPADSLPALARRAADLLRDDQDPQGYWLTAFTTTTRYAKPAREMNTFLTAVMTDLLAPLAGDCGLDENVARARGHLAAQIEETGLVRYHGRPDAPTIPALGAVITPDADDTALAWRIAGGDKQALLSRALETLNAYRTPQGLYKTWLAPREQYISIDPGADPDPADICIQMHMLMFLAKFDPPSARDLYGALRQQLPDDRIWVYYKKTTLIPQLREIDLRKAGFPLDLPGNRLNIAEPGQEPWVAACHLLAKYAGEGGRPDPRQVHDLLVALAKNDFAALRLNPPLLYHNDLTARVSRYYWSEDFGYALWLKLYTEFTRNHDH